MIHAAQLIVLISYLVVAGMFYRTARLTFGDMAELDGVSERAKIAVAVVFGVIWPVLLLLGLGAIVIERRVKGR